MHSLRLDSMVGRACWLAAVRVLLLAAFCCISYIPLMCYSIISILQGLETGL